MSSKKDKSNNLDNYFMSIAMNLASERIGLTGLNPSVGCVIVKNNKIISFGQTGFKGRPHAETVAITKCKKMNLRIHQYILQWNLVHIMEKHHHVQIK